MKEVVSNKDEGRSAADLRKQKLDVTKERKGTRCNGESDSKGTTGQKYL